MPCNSDEFYLTQCRGRRCLVSEHNALSVCWSKSMVMAKDSTAGFNFEVFKLISLS